MRSRIVLTLAGILFLVGAVGPQAAAEENGSHLPDWVIEQIVQRDDAISVARMLGLRELMGKSLEEGGLPSRGRRANAGGRVAELTSPLARRATTTTEDGGFDRRGHGRSLPYKLLDSAISALPDLDEWRPSVATRRNDPRTVVAVYSASPFTDDLKTRCLVKRSRDHGRTWSEPVFLPLLDPASNCLNPSLVWSSDGRWLFAAYQTVTYNRIDLPPPTPDTYKYRSQRDDDIFVTYSRNGGRTWTTPQAALKGEPWGATLTCEVATDRCKTDELHPGTSYSWPGIALSEGRSGRTWVYVTGTRESMLELVDPEPIAVVVTRAWGEAKDWCAPKVLDEGARSSPGSPQVSVQGSKPAAGHGGTVLVAWYHSGVDGFLEGDFEIRVAHSDDHGATWDDPVVAASDGEEVNFFLGPNDYYKQWWTAMFPDIVIDRRGRAHIVYTADPDREDLTAEEGDIRYVTSTDCPYDSWSYPETVNDDGEDRAQGFPVIAVRELRGRSLLDVMWEDTRIGEEITEPVFPLSSNYFYDIFHSHRVVGSGDDWSANTRVSDESSIQVKLGPSGRPGLGASDSLVFGAWIDRRNADSIDDTNLDVYGSRILPGKRGRH